MAVARPKRLTTVVVDPQLVPLPEQPEDPDATEAVPDAAHAANAAGTAEDNIFLSAGLDEVEDLEAEVPLRVAASR
jgi:precorrin-6x reductase